MSTPRVIVIGGGITGLSLAVTLREEARRLGERLDLVVLERDRVAGGHARTIESGGFVVEAGPNGFLNREPETLALVELLHLGPRLITANAANARRFIVRDGRLCRVPDSPWSLLRTPALSWRGKLRLLAEPWIGGPPGIEESVYDFAARRIGNEAASVLVDTAVSGINAGDSRRLSVAAKFPVMAEMERDHGSLFRGMLARKRSGLGPARPLSFDEGMGMLPRAMLALLGGSVVTGAAVTTIEREAAGWRIRMEDGCWLQGDHLVLATPAHAAAGLVAHANPMLAASLRETEYAGVSVVALGYRGSDVPRPLDGYGYLVPRAEDMATLGVVWESSLFAGRAPDGHVLVRAILGGVRRPAVVGWPDDECVANARSELARVLGIRAEPAHVSMFRWPKAIAQYIIGHHARLARVRGLAEALPGLHLCGTSYDGVSVNHAVKSGRMMARTLSAQLWQDARSPVHIEADTVAV
jgi:oxygen-dependent protoporphyrinogen oxidase